MKKSISWILPSMIVVFVILLADRSTFARISGTFGGTPAQKYQGMQAQTAGFQSDLKSAEHELQALKAHQARGGYVSPEHMGRVAGRVEQTQENLARHQRATETLGHQAGINPETPATPAAPAAAAAGPSAGQSDQGFSDLDQFDSEFGGDAGDSFSDSGDDW